MTIMKFVYQTIIIAVLLDPENMDVNTNIKSLEVKQRHIQTL